MAASHSSRRRSGATRLLRAALLPMLLLATALAHAQAARQQPDVSEVQGAFLVNFLRYTQWPASSFEGPNSPYVVTVVGSERAAAGVRAVAEAVGNIDGRPIEVRSLTEARGSRAAPFDSPRDQQARAALSASHLVFFHESAGRVHPQVLADLARLPVLTVSDTEGFTSHGGMLGLVRNDRRIVFQANPGAIRNASLLVSAKVLKLARAGTRPQ